MFPEVSSITVYPGLRELLFSASSIIWSAILSFFDIPGFIFSHLAKIRVPFGRFGVFLTNRDKSTSGVLPIESAIEGSSLLDLE